MKSTPAPRRVRPRSGWRGRYGLSTFGSPRETSDLLRETRIGLVKNDGALLYAAYNGGTIYTFDPADLATDGRAEALANAPTDVRAMFITEERFPFALCDNMVVAGRIRKTTRSGPRRMTTPPTSGA